MVQCSCLQKFTLSSLFIFVLCQGSHAEDWPHWGGPHRDGTTSETSGWNGKDWLADKPAWRGAVGQGSTTPLVVGKRLYTLGWSKDRDTLFCLDAQTGKQIWRRSYACPPYGRYAHGDQDWFKGVTSTPEYDTGTGLLYTLSCDGDLICWNASDGERLWHKNLYETYGVGRRPGRRDYGYTSSPLIVGDDLIVEVGASKGNLIGFDKQTGKQRWTSQNTDAAGHTAGPIRIRINNNDCLAVLTQAHLLVVSLEGNQRGKTLGQYEWAVQYNNGIPTLCAASDGIVVTSGYNQNRICLFELTPGGPKMRDEIKRDCSKVCTPVFHRGHLYIAYDHLRCYRVADNRLELQWKGSGREADFGRDGSCLVTKDDRLVVFGSRGRDFKLALAETASRSAKACRILSCRHKVFAGKTGSKRAWPRVVLANGYVYCKDVLGNIACFRLKR